MPSRLLPLRVAPGNIYLRHDRMAVSIDAACGARCGQWRRARACTPRCEMKFCWVRCTTQFLTGYSSVVQLLLPSTAVTKLAANSKRRITATSHYSRKLSLIVTAPTAENAYKLLLCKSQKRKDTTLRHSILYAFMCILFVRLSDLIIFFVGYPKW